MQKGSEFWINFTQTILIIYQSRL